MQIFCSIIALLSLCQVLSFAEARIGSLRLLEGKVWNRRKNMRPNTDAVIFPPREDQTPTISTTTSSVYDSFRHHPPVGVESTTTRTVKHQQLDSEMLTDAADLARVFQQALVSVNRDHQDLHVGNLLSACGRLEKTMRQIGFTQSANDISGNIKKIRNVYDDLPRDKRDSISTIVKYELELGVHGSDIHTLKDPSATMGFLWLGRSINYQYDMFRHMLDNGEEPYDAAKHAYEQDLKPHLSWPLQKVCQTAMTRLKPIRKNEMLSKIGGFPEDHYGSQEEQATVRDLRQVMDSWKPMLSKWREIFTDLGLDQI